MFCPHVSANRLTPYRTVVRQLFVAVLPGGHHAGVRSLLAKARALPRDGWLRRLSALTHLIALREYHSPTTSMTRKGKKLVPSL